MRNIGIDSVEHARRPIIALGNEYPTQLEAPEHNHRRAQLLYPRRGVVTVNTRHGSWVVPPERAMWIPAGIRHSARMSGAVSMRSLYIRQTSANAVQLPMSCCVIEVSPLLRALLEASVDLPLEYDHKGREARIMALILDEVRVMTISPLHAPIPSSPVLAELCIGLLQDPERAENIDVLARRLAMSRSSFTRRFRTETGSSFGQWLRQARFLNALRRIAAGESITSVALDSGYSSPSAFTSAFRKVLGVPPSRYF